MLTSQVKQVIMGFGLSRHFRIRRPGALGGRLDRVVDIDFNFSLTVDAAAWWQSATSF